MFKTINYSAKLKNRKIIFLLTAIFIFIATRDSYALNFSNEERVVKKERVIQIVTEYLKEIRQIQGSSIKLGDFKYNPIKLNRTNYSVTVSERRGSGKGKLLLELNFVNQKKEEKKLFLSIPLLEAKPVVFVKSNHVSGDVLSEENLLSGVKWLPYRDRDRGFISEISFAIGKRVNRKISKMAALKKNMLESVPILHKGDPVTIFIETGGGIFVTTKGVAKEDALAGDSIKVQNLHSKKIIQARVMSNEAVRIDF